MIKKRQRRSKIAPKRNPQLYSRTDTIRPEKKKGSFVKIFLFLLFLGFIYLFFFSPVFKLSKVTVIAEQKQKEIEDSSKKYFKKNSLAQNILLLNEAKLEEFIKKDKSVKVVKITKNYLNKTLTIKVEAEKPLAIWSEKGKRYLLNNAGIIYKEIGEGEEGSFNLIKINYKLSETHAVGDKTLNEHTFLFLSSLINNFENNISDKVFSIDFDNSQNEVTLFTDSYKIYFDTKRDATAQLNKISLVKKDAEAKSRNLDYIDLRIESRVFYKLK